MKHTHTRKYQGWPRRQTRNPLRDAKALSTVESLYNLLRITVVCETTYHWQLKLRDLQYIVTDEQNHYAYSLGTLSQPYNLQASPFCIKMSIRSLCYDRKRRRRFTLHLGCRYLISSESTAPHCDLIRRTVPGGMVIFNLQTSIRVSAHNSVMWSSIAIAGGLLVWQIESDGTGNEGRIQLVCTDFCPRYPGDFTTRL